MNIERLMYTAVGGSLYLSAYGKRAENPDFEKELGQRFGKIHNLLISNMQNNWVTDGYKKCLAHKKNVYIDVTTVVLALFGDVMDEKQLEVFFNRYLVDALIVFAKELMVRAHQSETLDSFKEDIEKCSRKVIEFYEDGAILFGRGIDIPDMDICSCQNLKWLMELLAICLGEDTYHNLYIIRRPKKKDSADDTVKKILTQRNEIFEIIMSHVSNGFQKEATKAFVKVSASVYSFYITSYMTTDKTRNIMGQIASQTERKLAEMSSPLSASLVDSQAELHRLAKWDEAFDDCEKLKHAMMSTILEVTQDGDMKKIQEITGSAIRNPDIAASGLILLMMQDGLWCHGFPQRAALVALNNVSALRMKNLNRTVNDAIEGSNLDITSTDLWNNISSTINNVSALFMSPKETFSNVRTAENPGLGGTNQQVLAANGLLLADLTHLPSLDDIQKTFYGTCKVHGVPPLEVLGAEIAVNILHQAGLLGNCSKQLLDDRPELAQRAIDAEAQLMREKGKVTELKVKLENASHSLGEKEDKIAELERKLAAKDKEIEKLRTAKTEAKSQLEELVLAVEQLGVEEFAPDNEQKAGFQATGHLSNLRIISYGGPHTFASQLQELLPTVSVYECGKVPPATALRLSDAVFLQVQYIGHPDYYSIRDICKANQIPCYHIPTSGAIKAAEFICEKAKELAPRS